MNWHQAASTSKFRGGKRVHELLHSRCKVFLKNVTEIGGYLEVTDDGKFGEYLPETAKPDGDIVEQSGKLIAPGLVDTHIHGLLGHDVMDNGGTALRQ